MAASRNTAARCCRPPHRQELHFRSRSCFSAPGHRDARRGQAARLAAPVVAMEGGGSSQCAGGAPLLPGRAPDAARPGGRAATAGGGWVHRTLPTRRGPSYSTFSVTQPQVLGKSRSASASATMAAGDGGGRGAEGAMHLWAAPTASLLASDCSADPIPSAANGDDNADAGSSMGHAGRILLRFVFFAVCFALNHGCVTAVLAYVQEFFDSVAQASLATLYGVYTGTALLFSAAMVNAAGYKYSLLFSLTMYCVYVSAYAIGGGFPAVQTPVIITGAVVGGFAAGFLWTAQGPYFRAFATRHAAARGHGLDRSTGLFAGIFAFVYLGFEVCLKLVAKPAFTGANISLASPRVQTLFSTYSLVCIVACVGLFFIPDLAPPQTSVATGRSSANGAPPTSSSSSRRSSSSSSTSRVANSSSAAPWYHRIVVVLQLLCRDPRAIALGVSQCSFGFSGETVNLYIAVEVLKCSGMYGVDALPNLPWFVAATPAVAAALQVPVALLVRRFGRRATVSVMCVGQLAFMTVGLLCALAPRDVLAAQGNGLVGMFILQGVGRASFEGANRAAYADTFAQRDAAAAFASMVLFSGGASTAAYASFLHLRYAEPSNCTYDGQLVVNFNGAAMGWITVAAGVLGLVAYAFAFGILKRPHAAAAAVAATAAATTAITDAAGTTERGSGGAGGDKEGGGRETTTDLRDHLAGSQRTARGGSGGDGGGGGGGDGADGRDDHDSAAVEDDGDGLSVSGVVVRRRQ